MVVGEEVGLEVGIEVVFCPDEVYAKTSSRHPENGFITPEVRCGIYEAGADERFFLLYAYARLQNLPPIHLMNQNA